MSIDVSGGVTSTGVMLTGDNMNVYMNVYDGGTANGTTVNSDGWMYLGDCWYGGRYGKQHHSQFRRHTPFCAARSGFWIVAVLLCAPGRAHD